MTAPGPGSFVLFAAGITAELSAQAQTAIDGLEGMLAASLVAKLTYGSGGTTIVAVVQTSIDDGTTWYDVARFDFETESAIKYANLSGLTVKGITDLLALDAEGVTDGVLGPQIRAVITSSGIYGGGTLLDLRMVAR